MAVVAPELCPWLHQAASPPIVPCVQSSFHCPALLNCAAGHTTACCALVEPHPSISVQQLSACCALLEPNPSCLPAERLLSLILPFLSNNLAACCALVEPHPSISVHALLPAVHCVYPILPLLSCLSFLPCTLQAPSFGFFSDFPFLFHCKPLAFVAVLYLTSCPAPNGGYPT